MPDIDLPPGKYRVQTRNGNWLNRESGPLVFVALAMALPMIIFVWWNRSEIALASMLGLTAMMSFGAGMVAGAWLKRFD